MCRVWSEVILGTVVVRLRCRVRGWGHFGFGGRRKAVRDRLALQGGTGDFP